MSFLTRFFFIGAIFVQIITSIVAYHFDADNVILYEDPAKIGSRGSYFGYSIALWNPGEESSDESWIFIGAPRANSSAYARANEPGTVFKCKIREKCTEWVMTDRDVKSGSWLGGSMTIANNSYHDVVACAPRWMEEHDDFPDTMLLRGSCWSSFAEEITKGVNDDRRVNPLSNKFEQPTDEYKHWLYGLGQAGFSIHPLLGEEDGFEFVLGCPGIRTWHGNQIHISESEETMDEGFFERSIDTFGYSGYAVTSGHYFDAAKRVYATGAPRGASLRGGVVLFDFFSYPTLDDSNLYGEQIGEYFGSALASCDIDGNERDDLLVGAPYWTETLDEGRIYVFRTINSRFAKKFEIRAEFNGQTPRGRFGSTITCLGDIDYDGYADVAVGAPYDGNGAVHIFHGGKDGLRLSQIIAGPEPTKGFGISISEPRDIDDNGYADFAVGAYLSGHVTLIRSKRIVATTVTISTDLSEGQLNLTTEFFPITVCSSYAGAYAPQELNITRELKIDEVYERAAVEIDGEYLKTYKHSETLESRVPNTCRNYTIKIDKKENFDYSNPLDISVSQRLDTIQKNSKFVVGSNDLYGEDDFDTMDTVMNGSDRAVVDTRKIQFKVQCGNDTCRSHLSVEILTDLKIGKPFLIGSRPDLQLFVKVHNSEENAYLAKVFVDIPIFMGILKLEPTCVKYSNMTTHSRIMCDVGNPLAKNETITFTMRLDMSAVLINHTTIEFKAVATTVSIDDFKDNEGRLLITGTVAADIGIAGSTDTDWNSYMQPENKERLPNIMFSHIYEIRNHNVTPLSEALLSISFPTHWVDGDDKNEIVKLNHTVVDLDGRQINCKNQDKDSDISIVRYDATLMPEWLLGGNSSSQAEKKFMIIDGKVFGASPDNRTLYINTTNPSVEWKTIDCLIGPFKTARSTAKVVITFDLLLSKLPSELLDKKDIIFFATNGSTKITVPHDFIQTVNNKPDVVMIGTMFVGSTIAKQKVATWVVALSVGVGLLLLMLLIIALCKFGFFNRSKKLELEALKNESKNMDSKVVLETSSSTEALDLT